MPILADFNPDFNKGSDLMEWLTAALSGIFSGLAQGFLALFGMSDAQKLGRAEVANSDLKAELTELKAEDAAAADTPHGKSETIEALKNGDL